MTDRVTVSWFSDLTFAEMPKRAAAIVRSLAVRTYGSAQEFLAALPDGFPQCLVLDLQMPEMTGLDLLALLRRRGIQIPAIVITAHGDAEAGERCESVGAVALLSKPLRNASLFAAIDRAIST